MSENKTKGSLVERIGSLESFRLGKGITRENGSGQWTKEYIEVEVKLPEKANEKDFIANFTATEYLIDQLLEQPKTAAPPAETKPAPPQVKITMEPPEIDALPWTASSWVRKNDQDRRARTGEDAWIREDELKEPRLLEMLKAGGKFEMPGAYSFEHKVREGYTRGLIIRYGPHKRKN